MRMRCCGESSSACGSGLLHLLPLHKSILHSFHTSPCLHQSHEHVRLLSWFCDESTSYWFWMFQRLLTVCGLGIRHVWRTTMCLSSSSSSSSPKLNLQNWRRQPRNDSSENHASQGHSNQGPTIMQFHVLFVKRVSFPPGSFKLRLEEPDAKSFPQPAPHSILVYMLASFSMSSTTS
jgi:hypothetical protein